MNMSSKYRVSLPCACGGSFTLHSRADHFRTMRHTQYETPPTNTNNVVDSLADFVMSNLDITNNDNDYIFSSVLYNMFNDKSITTKTFKTDLLKLGIGYKRKKKGNVFTGIKQKLILI